jgi:hypothetical protein
MPIILKVGIDPVHFGLVLTLNPDDRAVASTARHGVVRLGAKNFRPLNRADYYGNLALANPAARIARRHHAYPKLTLWLPRVTGLLK